MSEQPKNIFTVRSKEELDKLRPTLHGPVVLEFVDEKNCDACIEDAPKVEQFVKSCGTEATLVKVPIDLTGNGNSPGDKLADEFRADALPGLFVAQSGADLTPEKAKAVDDSSGLKKLIKCSRK